ncbi:MAG: MFS transporter [Bacteroidetes bacterium]|nr:MFS transporter [Bacteroidota bacterium]
MKPGKVSLLIVSPVLFAFFIMSFCDLVGIGVDNAKADFQLSNTLAQLIPLAVFAWFFILSVPVGILQDRIGKKNMVNISMLITAGGLLLPFFYYSFPTLLIGFALLGIGNTIIQVSANPLLIDVVPQRTRSSFLSFSQFVKAVGSMIAPYLASFFAIRYGNWKLVFLIFGVFSILSVLWLQLTKITETRTEGRRASFTSALRLLGEPYIALMVLGIFLLVGIDVGINSTSGQFLMERLGMEPEPAKMGRSLYFFGKMLGTFSGALLLTRINTRNFLLISAWATLVSLLVFLWSPFPVFALVLMFLMGLASSNIFPLIFVLTAGRYSSHTNEISGLIIMAVSGGAFIPPLAGKITDMGGVIAGMLVFVGCAIYLLFLAYKNLRSPGKLL